MSERAYQQKMFKSEKKVVFCNWDRGSGKTHSIANRILRNINGLPKKIMVVASNTYNMMNELHKQLDTIENNYKIEYQGREDIVIKNDNFVPLVKIKISNPSQIQGVNRGFLPDYVYSDEYMPSNIDMSFFGDKLKQVFIMFTLEDFEYIDMDSQEGIEDKDLFIDKQIEELLLEFGNTVKESNTTRTRNDILAQIDMLNKIKAGLK